MSATISAFPDPSVAGLQKVGRKTLYRTPDGDFPRVTSILDALPKPFLVPWAARVEREACLAAAGSVYADGVEGGVQDFLDAVEARLGPAKEHQKQMQKAADIGTAAHEEIQRQTRKMLGLQHGPEVDLPDGALVAVMAWQDWLKGSGLTPFRTEQTVWCKELECAGTIDLLAFDPAGRLGIVDYKTSKGLYDSHHVQVATYGALARNFAPIEWSLLVRIPKDINDPAFEVKELGQMYDRTLTPEELVDVFRAARVIYRALVEK